MSTSRNLAVRRPRFETPAAGLSRYNDLEALQLRLDDALSFLNFTAPGAEWSHDPSTKAWRQPIHEHHVNAIRGALEYVTAMMNETRDAIEK